MASVQRQQDSKYWRAFWYDTSGKLRGKSTGQVVKAKAVKVAYEFERLDRALKERTTSVRQAQRVIEDLARELGETPETTPTIRQWFDGWLKDREPRLSQSTAGNYDKALRSFYKHLGKEADHPLPSLTTRKIQSWLDTLQHLASGTVANYMDPVKGALLKAWKRGVLPQDLTTDLEMKPIVNAQRDSFTAEEINMLLAAASPDWKIVILAGAYAGLRIHDAAHLTWKMVDLAQGTLRVTQGKTKREVLVPLHSRLRTELEARAGDDPEAPVTPSLNLDTKGSHGLSGKFKALMRQAGIGYEDRGSTKRKMASKSSHSLRHTFVRRLLEAGVDESVRMRLAGHASQSAHRVYSVPEIALLRKAVEALP